MNLNNNDVCNALSIMSLFIIFFCSCDYFLLFQKNIFLYVCCLCECIRKKLEEMELKHSIFSRWKACDKKELYSAKKD